MKMPSYAVLMGEIKKKNPRLDSSSDLVISKELFEFLLKIAVSASEYDEKFYVDKNPDIKAAIAKGVLKNGREHYINVGYREGRRAYLPVVDENWYRATYPDVDKAVKEGCVESGDAHFKAAGWIEGRSANLADLSDINLWKAMLRS